MISLIIVFTPLALLLITGLLIYKFKYERMIRLTKNWPSPPALPIIGHGHYFINKTPNQLLLKFKELRETYGESMKLWLGPELNLWLGDVKDVEAVLGSTLINDKATQYKTLEAWLNEGLLISRGQKWHKRRKILTPAFHFKILDDFIEIFVKESEKLVQNLKREMKMEKQILLYDWINLCTLDSICGII